MARKDGIKQGMGGDMTHAQNRDLWFQYVDNFDLNLPPRKKLLFDKLFQLIEEGEPATVRYVLDQVMGKPVQSVKQELTGRDGKDLSAGIFIPGGLKDDNHGPESDGVSGGVGFGNGKGAKYDREEMYGKDEE